MSGDPCALSVCYLCGQRARGAEVLVYTSVCDAPAHPSCAQEASEELVKLGAHPGRWAKIVRGEEEP